MLFDAAAKFVRSILFLVMLAAAMPSLAAEPDWFVKNDDWVTSYLQSADRLCLEEKEEGRQVPLYKNDSKLPVIIYPKTVDRLSDIEIDADVSNVSKLYIGCSARMELYDAKLIDNNGVEHPLCKKDDLTVPFTKSNERAHLRIHYHDSQPSSLQMSDNELAVELGNKYQRLTGKLRSNEREMVFWMDVDSRFEKLRTAARIRRDLWRYIEGTLRANLDNNNEKYNSARGQIERMKPLLPSFYQQRPLDKSAKDFAESFLQRYEGKTDERILETVAKKARSTRSQEDFKQLVQLAFAAVNYDHLRHTRSVMASRKDFPGLMSSFEKFEREFFQLDAKKFDYSLPMLARLKAFRNLPEECDEATARVELARKTIEFVNRVNPVSDKVREQLDSLETQLDNNKADLDVYLATRDEISQLRREVLFSHPALDFEKILINRSPPPKYSHNGDQHLGRHSRIGPGLTILSDWKSGKPKLETPLADKLPLGSVRNPDLHYDAEKLVFAFCNHESESSSRGSRRFFLYEAALDGSWLRQLTGTKRDPLKTWDNRATAIIEDNDPCYLPDGGLVFISTRSQSFGRCHGGRYNPAWVLHRCDANGDNIQQLSFGNENEYEPSVLNDGRIVFTRWEYTNRHEMYFHMLWWCRPDGTNVSHYYGNDTLAPMMVVEASAIPGTHKITATAQGHHSYNTGTTVMLDTNKGENGEEPVTHITPETPYSENHGWPSPHYSHPYAITEDLFLVSRANHPVHKQGQTPPVADRAIYLIDSLGGRELIYEDPEVASFSPIAIRKRTRPPAMPPRVPENAPDYGTVFLQNAYLTRNDPEGKIKPGAIKAIRVNAIGVQPRARRSACSSTVPAEIPKKVLGTIPINPDGSAYFKIPARTSVQMQILDENGMAIMTEKSLFYLQPGENRSCVGCHEPVGASPDMAASSRASRMAPRDLDPPAGPQYKGGLSFMRTVQPVLDRYCIKCHGLEKTEKAVNLVDNGGTYPQSYKALAARGDHRLGLKGYKSNESAISRPFEYYSHSNKVPHMLIKGHNKVDIDRDSFMRIVEWLDLNAQCYGDLFPNKLEERRIDAKALEELRAYVKELFGDKIASQPERALINVAQIDESRILMAPLAEKAGGWGQLKGWNSKNHAGYEKMAELVDKCITRRDNENCYGWQPTPEAGAGESWVLQAREELKKSFEKEEDTE